METKEILEKQSEILADVGAQIKKARLAAKMTLEEVGFAVGGGKQYISGIERGIQTISLRQLEKVANAVGCTVVVEIKKVKAGKAGKAKG